MAGSSHGGRGVAGLLGGPFLYLPERIELLANAFAGGFRCGFLDRPVTANFQVLSNDLGGDRDIVGGQVVDDLVDVSDFWPTILELAGLSPPKEIDSDGVSFADGDCDDLDPAVFPGWDENNDFIPDFNQNDNGGTVNVGCSLTFWIKTVTVCVSNRPSASVTRTTTPPTSA